MTEYTYRIERDFTPEVNRIAAQIQHKVDQAALDKIADTLEQYGYVKVVRCKDCKHYDRHNARCTKFGIDCYLADPQVSDLPGREYTFGDYGFCAWGERRDT